MKGTIISLSLLLFGAVALTNGHSSKEFEPIEEKLHCIKHCHTDGQNETEHKQQKYVQFELGKTYRYDVKILNQVLAKINKSQTEEFVEENLVQIDAQCKLSALNPCEMSMVMENVQLKFSNWSPNIDEEIERYIRQFKTPIIFSYKDGIVTEVCSPTTTQDKQQQDEPFVINVKKSIISALQTVPNILDNQQDGATVEHKVVETDYHGECQTEYHIQKNKSTDKYSVLKEKDLLKCSYLDDSSEYSDLGYLVKESRQATSHCRQQIESKHVVQSECRSMRSLDTMMDHFNLDLIAQIQVIQTSVEDNNDEQRKQVREMLFKHQGWLRNIYRLHKQPSSTEKSSSTKSTTETDLKQIVQQICEDIQHNSNRVGLKTADYVQRLSQAFQNIADENQIKSVWETIRDGQQNVCGEQSKKLKDIFVDTAASVLNEYTGPIVRDELLKLYEKQLEDPMAKERVRYLSTSMSFAQNPSIQTVKQIVPELLTKIEDPDVILSISALVKQVEHQQQQQQQQQDESTEIREQIYKIVLDKVLDKIQRQQQTVDVDIVRMLKSLQNISPRTNIPEQEKLISIITGQQQIQSSIDYEWIRSIAIRSLESVQPTQNVRQTLMSILTNVTETNEIRITAYRTLIATGTNVEELKQILDVIQKEQQQTGNRHVYNYICSHQKIMRNTQDQPKRSSLPQDAPVFPEPSSIMEVFLSRHYEYSYVNGQTPFGSFIETDVIMAGDEYGFAVPRTITVNVTMPIGSDTKQQIPVVEATIRQKGFEVKMAKKILNNIGKLIAKQPKMNGQLFQQLNKLIEQHSDDQTEERRLQLLLNVDGKNIFVYDSKDQRSRLANIWTFMKEKFPVKFDQTVVVMPWQKRVAITQTASGVPMYFEINTTYIGSLDAMVTKQQTGEQHYLEMMLKPTIVAQTIIAIGNGDHNEHSVPMSNQFRIVNRMLSAPTIHFNTEIKDDKQLKVKFILPEQEQVWWRSETKIIKAAATETNDGRREIQKRDIADQHMQTKCTDSTMKLVGVSLCYKKVDSPSVQQEQQNEIVVDYKEIVLKKQNDQIEGLELVFELPEALLAPVFVPTSANEMKFGFSLSTPTYNQSSTEPRFQTEVIVRVPTEQKEELTVQFTVGALKKKIHGNFEFVDKIEQKTLKLEINNERNTQLFRLNANGQFNDKQKTKTSRIDYVIDIQPFEGSRIYNGQGIVSYERDDEQNQKNVQIKFESNGQQMADVTFIQKGQIDQQNVQISFNSMVNVFDLKTKQRWLYSQDEQTIKSLGKIGYNRFWTSNQLDQYETCEIEYQSSIYDSAEQQNSVKRHFHYKMVSSQFPEANFDVSYNKKRQPDLIDEEFVLKYGKDFQRNQLKVDQTTRITQNVHARDTIRVDTKMNVEFRPKNIHYEIKSTIDVTKSEPKKQMNIAVEVQDRRRSEKVMETNFQIVQTSLKPFQMESIGEMKFFRPQPYVISCKHKVHQIPEQQDKYRGKIEITTVSQNGYIPEVLPKVFQMQYDYQTNDQQPVNKLQDIFTRFGKIQHELFFENEQYGHLGHMCLLETGNDRQQLKAVMRREGEQVYKVDVVQGVTPQDQRHYIKFVLDTVCFNQLNVDGELQWKVRQVREVNGQVKTHNDYYNHETRFNIENDGSYDFDTETKQQDQLVFSMKNRLVREQKRQKQKFNLETESNFLNLNIDAENFFPSKKFDEQDQDSYGKVQFQLPKYDVEHQSKVQMKNPSKSFVFDSQTRHHGRNVLKFNFKAQSNMGQIQGEFGGDLRGQLRVEKIDNQTYELNMDIHAPQQQIIHQTKAQWKKQTNQWPVTIWNQYQVISIDMKNYLGENNLIDVHYKRSDDQKQYQHQFTASTRQSHSEVSWSYSKALIVFKTKLMGGIDHQTELKDITFPSFKIDSKTRQNNRNLIQLTGDVTMKNSEKTTVQMVLGENQHRIQMEIVPYNRIQAEYQSDNGQTGEMKWVRSSPKQWSMVVQGENRQKRSSEWRVDVDHECNKYTKVTGQSSVIKGRMEYHCDTRRLNINLKGQKNEQFEDFEQQTKAQWTKDLEKLQIQSQTSKSGRKLISVDVDYDKSNSFRFDGECNLKQFPVELKSMVNLNDRHVNFELHDKKQDRQAHFETKAKEWKDFKVQCAWGPKQDKTKKVLIESSIKPEDGKAIVRGQWFQHQIEGKAQTTATGKEDFVDGQYKLEAKYSDIKTKQEKKFKFEHQCDSKGTYETEIECRNGQTNIITGRSQLNVRGKRSVEFEMKTETDLNGIWDVLNSEAKFSHYCGDESNFQQKGSIQCGSESQRKYLNLSGNSDSSAIVYHLVSGSSSSPEQTFKMEWNKPERKLQINVYNQNGRIVDVNVDVLAKALQKKFQIVSFTDQIPTIDVEAIFGENSRLVFALSFRQEKKLELSLNWFGQWRRDYRANVLFKSYAEPQFEMMVVSHHPATFDKIDAVLKYQNREIKAKWNDQFDDEKQQQREAIIEVDGRKSIHLNVDRKQEQNSKSPNQEIVYYEGRLDGDYKARGNAQVVIDKSSPTYDVKMIKIEIEKQTKSKRQTYHQEQTSQHFLIELYFHYQEQPESPQITGVKIERSRGKPVLVATYVEPTQTDGQKPTTVNTLGHLYLLGEVDYQMYNEITYETKQQHPQIKQIKSQLKKRQPYDQTMKTLADFDVVYYQDENDPKTNVVRVHVQSPNFSSNPKVFKVRYNIDGTSSKCQQSNKRWTQSDKQEDQQSTKTQCSRVQIIFGDEHETKFHKKPVSISLEYGERPLENNSFNRTILFSIDTLNETNMNRVLNFTILAHISGKSIGYKWHNINRYGYRKSGQFYMQFKPKSTNGTVFDYQYQYDNEKNVDESSSYQVHVDTDSIKNSFIRFKWSPMKVIKSLIKGDIPRIEQLSRRTDLCELSNQVVREFKDELRYKWRLFKRQAIDREVIAAIYDEVQQVRRQMKRSQDPIANKLVECFDKILEKYEDLTEKIDFERTIDGVLESINRIIEHVKEQMIKMVKEKCFDNEQCSNLYRKVRDYEIRHYIRKCLMSTIEKFQEEYMPKTMKRSDCKTDCDDSIFNQVKQFIHDELHGKNIFHGIFCPEFLSEIIEEFSNKKQQQKNEFEEDEYETKANRNNNEFQWKNKKINDNNELSKLYEREQKVYRKQISQDQDEHHQIFKQQQQQRQQSNDDDWIKRTGFQERHEHRQQQPEWSMLDYSNKQNQDQTKTVGQNYPIKSNWIQ